jgi:hypothetical protein
MLDAVIQYLPSPVDIPPVKPVWRTMIARRAFVHALDSEKFLRSGVQDDDRPVCWPADRFPSLFRRA